MTTLHETAYPSLKPDPTARELAELYTPTEDERVVIAGIGKRALPRVAALLHLKVFQRLGYFIPLSDVPQAIRDHVAQHAGITRVPTLADLKRFEASGSRMALFTALRRHLNVKPLMKPAGYAWLDVVADTAAESKHAVADIINVMLEELVHHRYELPAFSTLDRIAFRAREKSNNQYFSAIAGQLNTQTMAMIEGLLKTATGEPISPWQMLKREPKRPTNKETRTYIQHIRRLQHLVEQLPKPQVPVPKLKQFRHLARALNAAEMAELKPKKRYALAVIFIRAQHAQSLDDAADLFIRLMQNLENNARQKLLSFQQERVQKTDMLVGQLKDILGAYQLEGTDTQRVDAIGTTLVADVNELLNECEQHLAYAGRNHLPFLLQPYKMVRAQLLNCIGIASPKASSEDQVVERLIEALYKLRDNRADIVLLDQLGLTEEKDFHWMSAQWKRLVLFRPVGKGRAEAVHRRYFELAVMHAVKDDLKSGDLFIKYGERYDDYREQLVDDKTFEKEVGNYGQVTGIETDPCLFVSTLKSAMAQRAREIDANFAENSHAEIVDGRLILRKPPRSDIVDAAARIDALITERMETASIVDVMIDTERWLDLHKLFRPLAGTDSRLEDLRMRVITTLFCYGCNLGPVQTAKSIKGLSRRQISWLNLKYVSEDLLDKAIVKVINAYNKFELPGYWGTGKHASADGTKWNLYEQNLLSEHHIRYGGYGGIGYYHVSDKFIALFSHFISCGTYEGIHILDGLMTNESDIRPDTIHGDTQAQSYPVFALAHLLGIQLMPRIRGIQNLKFHRPEAGIAYKNINALFSDVIDWRLIELHLPAMLRVAVSIKTGKITPSAILRRLGTYSRKNKLYFAFVELGKVIRTMFLLSYIGDVGLRKVIHAQTNKSEQFNGFAGWSFFGGEGIIAENIRHEQRKVIKYNHLVANMIILHNVVGMTRVLRELRDEGREITLEILGGLAPFRTAHINRFGDYTLDFRRKIGPLNFDAPIIQMES